MSPAIPGLFVTGTDTAVGKTSVAAAVVRSLTGRGIRVGVMKPAMTGVVRVGNSWSGDDAAQLIAAAGVDVPMEKVTPFVFEEPLAPCVAARRAGRSLGRGEFEERVNEALAWWSGRADLMVIEGVGGWLCPLTEGTTVADLAVTLDYPVLVVARLGLGTLNHTLLTVEAVRSRSVRLAGVILNGAEPPSNPAAESTNAEELARRLPGVVLFGERPFDPGHMLPDPILSVDWGERAKPPRGRSF
jgi:dethiobiotin synthetase